MKLLLTVTAVLEVLTGIGLIVFPSMIISLLIGTLPEGAAGTTLARIAGTALISLAIAGWLQRNNGVDSEVTKAMLFYNIAAAAVLGYGAIRYKLSGAGLWPVVLLHASLALWCFKAVSQHKKTTKNI